MKISDIKICKSTADPLWCEHEPDLNSYVIARQAFQKDKSIKEQRRAVIDRVNNAAYDVIDEHKKHFFDDSHVIILWDNLPHIGFYTDSLGYSERHLLKTVLSYLKNKRECFLFIECPKTLSSSKNCNYMEVLENLYFIWKTFGQVPYFIDDDFLVVAKNEDVLSEEYKKDHDSFDGIILAEGYEGDDFSRLKLMKKAWVEHGRKAFIEQKNKDFFIRFFSSIESLISITDSKIDFEIPTGFIDIYFDYKSGKITTEQGIQSFCQESRATWYRYIKSFEESPLYENYAGFFDNNIGVKGCSVEESIEMLSLFHSLLPYYENPSVPYNCYLTYLYEQFDFIHAVDDVWNHLDRAEKTVNIALHKTPKKFRKMLEERGLTFEDLSRY